jgi:Ca2+-binding EF-hand superfamily protein
MDSSRKGYLSFSDFKNVTLNLKITTTDDNIKEMLNCYSLTQSIAFEEYILNYIVFIK